MPNGFVAMICNSDYICVQQNGAVDWKGVTTVTMHGRGQVNDSLCLLLISNSIQREDK